MATKLEEFAISFNFSLFAANILYRFLFDLTINANVSNPFSSSITSALSIIFSAVFDLVTGNIRFLLGLGIPSVVAVPVGLLLAVFFDIWFIRNVIAPIISAIGEVIPL